MTHIILHNYLPKRKTRDDNWSNDKIRQLYRSWTSGGQKPQEAIGELAENSGKSEQEIQRILRTRDALPQKPFTVVLLDSKGRREEISVQASGSVEAIYKAKQKFLENRSAAPTVLGIKKAQDYLANMSHFSAKAEWQDGTRTNLYLMATTLEDAKRQFKAQVNKGGWPKLTDIKAAQAKPEPR